MFSWLCSYINSTYLQDTKMSNLTERDSSNFRYQKIFSFVLRLLSWHVEAAESTMVISRRGAKNSSIKQIFRGYLPFHCEGFLGTFFTLSWCSFKLHIQNTHIIKCQDAIALLLNLCKDLLKTSQSAQFSIRRHYSTIWYDNQHEMNCGTMKFLCSLAKRFYKVILAIYTVPVYFYKDFMW